MRLHELDLRGTSLPGSYYFSFYRSQQYSQHLEKQTCFIPSRIITRLELHTYPTPNFSLLTLLPTNPHPLKQPPTPPSASVRTHLSFPIPLSRPLHPAPSAPVHPAAIRTHPQNASSMTQLPRSISIGVGFSVPRIREPIASPLLLDSTL